MNLELLIKVYISVIWTGIYELREVVEQRTASSNHESPLHSPFNR